MEHFIKNKNLKPKIIEVGEEAMEEEVVVNIAKNEESYKPKEFFLVEWPANQKHQKMLKILVYILEIAKLRCIISF